MNREAAKIRELAAVAQAVGSGHKADAGKPRPALVLGDFSRALAAVVEVGTAGALKYADNNWLKVPAGQARYTDAMLRHWLAEAQGQPRDTESGALHAAHIAWNALARLELLLRLDDEEPFHAEVHHEP